MKIVLWPIDKPIPYKRNARRITDAAIARVAASIKEYGWQQPVVVDSDGVIIVGHARILAARQLGIEQVPVLVATDLTPAQVKAYRLMDNRSHDATLWNVEMLADELQDLNGLDFDLKLTGFDEHEFDSLFPKTEGTPRRLYQTETVPLADLHPHPRNYRSHPDDQLEHIIQSIKEHGFYRNIVVAQDNTILAGHGLVEACQKMGTTHIRIVRLDVAPDSVEALKILAGDNDIQNRGEVDDRALTEILKEIRTKDNLLGSGYDDMMLANLLYVTRPSSEIRSMDRAADWVGMPEFDTGEKPLRITICFRSAEDRDQFTEQSSLEIQRRNEKNPTWTTWWPPKENDDLSALKFEVVETA